MVDVVAIPPVGPAEAMALAAEEDARFLSLLRQLDTADWSRPTDCSRWDVRAVAGHVLGSAKDAASVRRSLRNQRRGAKLARELGLPESLDGVNELHVRDHAHLGADELLAELAAWQPQGRAGRARLPRPLRRAPITAMGLRFTLGQLVDVILTRDVWMHRVDITRATGRRLELTPDHDGRLVADVVAEWARRHGQPFQLTVTGPAGGRFRAGTGGPEIELDAVELCRTLAGRSPGSGLLEHRVVF